MSIKLSTKQFKDVLETKESLFNDNIWNSDRLATVALYLYERPNTLKPVLTHERMSKNVKEVIKDAIQTEYQQILSIYWNEFKIIRTIFKDVYFSTVQQYEETKSKLINVIYTQIELNPFFLISQEGQEQTRNKSIVELYLSFLYKFSPNEKLVCKICFDNPINRVLAHKNGHACCLCHECEDKLDSTNIKCPFCNVSYTSSLKIAL
jgi:hypothetical protein